MIRDCLHNLSRYKSIHPDMDKVIEFFTQANFAEGRYNLSNACFININSFQSRKDDPMQFETHKDYADIQVLLAGEELQYYHNKDALSIIQPYTPDIALYHSKDRSYLERILLYSNDFVVYFPGEAHAPGYCIAEEKNCLKAVVKLKF